MMSSTCVCELFFFFSSRRRHTRFDCDWSSDVCSSDLEVPAARLGSSTQLGWTTWLTHAEPAQDARDFRLDPEAWLRQRRQPVRGRRPGPSPRTTESRSEEHTSELQSQSNLVCRLLLEK